MDENFKREILLDHYSHARNRGLTKNKNYLSLHNASDSCIDDITVEIHVENDIIDDVKFDGVGCTISTASTSILSDLIKGKNREEALKIINEYFNMLDEKPYDSDILEEANAFDTLYKQPNRIKCGMIGVKAMKKLIEESYEK